MKYRLALQLYKIHNTTNQYDDWTDYNFQQHFNGRMNKIHIADNSRLRIGRNCMMNNLSCINNTIDFGQVEPVIFLIQNQLQNDFLIKI